MGEFLFSDMEPSIIPEVDEDHPLRLPGAESGPDFETWGRPLVVACGAGVNSTAVLVGLEERGIRPDLILFADTGGEKPETYAFLVELRRWIVEVDFPELVVVRNDGMHGTLEQECQTNGVLPSKAYGYAGCSDKYKARPQKKYLKTWQPALDCWEAGEKVWRAIGYHAGEPHRAVKFEDDLFRYWHPLIAWNWDQNDCTEAIKRAGLPIPPKSACFYCPSSTKREVFWLQQHHPDLFARAVAMERNAAGYNERCKGLGRRFSWEGLVSLPLLDAANLPDPPAPPCMCDDGGCDDE